MDPPPARTDASWSLASTLAAVGAFLGPAGVLLGWFHVDVYSKSDIFGTELVQSRTLSGMKDFTGLVVLAAGLVVGLVAMWALLSSSDGARRASAIVAVVGGLVLLAVAVLGLTRVGSVADAASLGATGDRAGTAAMGLWVSAAGGLLATVGGLLARRLSG